jgi:hypothetical protein
MRAGRAELVVKAFEALVAGQLPLRNGVHIFSRYDTGTKKVSGA